MTGHTYPTTQSFGSIVVEVESQTTPGTYVAPVGFDQKALTLTAGNSEANLPANDAPDAPGWTARGVSALSAQVTGSGVYAKDDQAVFEGWFDSGTPRNVRVREVGVGYRVGQAILTNLGITASRTQNANLAQRSMTIDSDGPWPWTAGDPA